MKIVAIVQARMGSKRLPGKVMELIGGTAAIEVLIRRLSRSQTISQIVLATSNDMRNKPLKEIAETLGVECFLGSEEDVLTRYLQAAEKYHADVVVRVTGDCPLIDAGLLDTMVQEFKKDNVDYLANTMPPTFPDGLDLEIFTKIALKKSSTMTKSPYDREHVTPYIRNSGKFKTKNYENKPDLSRYRWTLDELTDLDVIRKIFSYFAPNIYFTWQEVSELQIKRGDIFADNKKIMRNEGAMMGQGQKLWKRAKNIIPGGNMLLSKRSEMFLPDQWPSYFSKSSGCKVWDLDGRSYTDMSIMGIGTNVLGYGHPEVDEAVQKTIKDGNMSTLNCPEEVYLAERLIELHPWSEMARFTRSGGEANAVAVRIARAASRKDKIAICGYHGWHDWYLAANLGHQENLNNHLLPGLETSGVPKNLKNTVYPFNYNDLDKLQEIIKSCDVGVIKMEVARNLAPKNDFLQKVRDLATLNDIVLIFDECTSGFRETNGGLHKKYNVEPDIAVFGKALGNGYAVNAIIGKRQIMEAAQTTFISSTFWTERIGPTAALKTLEVMKREKSWKIITQKGLKIKQGWQEIANKFELKINQGGIPALASFNFLGPNAAKYKTLITQEMLNEGYLASNSIYVCTAHTDEIINSYFEKLEAVFSLIKECEDGRPIDKLLNGPVCHSNFKRLN